MRSELCVCGGEAAGSARFGARLVVFALAAVIWAGQAAYGVGSGSEGQEKAAGTAALPGGEQGKAAGAPALQGGGGILAASDPYCTVDAEGLKYMAPDSIRMASLLEKIVQSTPANANPFASGERAEALKRQVAGVSDPRRQVPMMGQMATHLLNAGRTVEAIETLDALEEIRKQNGALFSSRLLADLRFYQALAWLRLGEQENCLTNHNAQSCVFPISGGGVHKLQKGSRKAIEILEARLAVAPTDRKCLWLLNVAYMTVGEYPAKVPSAWRIPPEAFKSDYDIKHFSDVAGNVGLDVNDLAGGTIAEDFDNDGDLDLLLSDWSPRGPLHYFVNNGDGTFSDETVKAGLSGLVGGLHVVQGDYNNDGLADVLVLRGAWLLEGGNFPDSLLRNDGGGHFTDVTEEAGLMEFAPNQAAVWFDFNGDGWLDIFVGYESAGKSVHPCKLYRNNRNGTFTECAEAAGVNVNGYVKGATSGDYNNDGRPDLYLSRRGQPNILFRNDGPREAGSVEWKFTDVTIPAGVGGPVASFPTWFFDYNNDGWEDLFVAGYNIRDVGDAAADYLPGDSNAERCRLYKNNGNGTFKDVTKEMGLYKVVHAMGSNFGDFDNDGWLDMLLGTGDPHLGTIVPNRAFRNNGGKGFQDVTTSGGFGHLQKGHGVSFADLDRDGDQDIYHSVGGAYEGDVFQNVLYENPGHGNHWINLKLVGIKSNRSAIGAKIKVVVDNGGAERAIYKTVNTGGSFGANPLEQAIGLGPAKAIKRVEIFWPATGKTQVVSNVRMDRFYQVREDRAEAELESFKPFKFSTTPPKGHGHKHPGT